LFERHVLGSILAAFHHRAAEARVSFWRDRDGREADFLVEARTGAIPIEVKVGKPGRPPRLDALRDHDWTDGWVVSLGQEPGSTARLAADWTLVSPIDLVPRVLGLAP